MTIKDFFSALLGRRLPKPLPTFQTLSYGKDAKQAMDVYRPPNCYATDRRDCIVFVHGGGFVDGDKDNPGVADVKSAYYNGKGKVFVLVNYRLNVEPSVQAQDVAAAVKYALPGIGRIILMAHSAGGTDAALAIAYELCDVDRIVLLDPASLDAVATMDHPHDPVFAPLGATQADWERNSPIAQLSGPTPPWMIVVSGDRGPAFVRQAQAFADKALHLGSPQADVVQFPDLSHEDCNKLVGTPCALTDAINLFLGAPTA